MQYLIFLCVADIEKFKKNSIHMKKCLESYMDELNEIRAHAGDAKNSSFTSNKSQEHNTLSCFSFKDENDLNMMENQLQCENLHFTDKLVCNIFISYRNLNNITIYYMIYNSSVFIFYQIIQLLYKYQHLY